VQEQNVSKERLAPPPSVSGLFSPSVALNNRKKCGEIFMSRVLKRNEGLTEGLQRVSKKLLRTLFQAIGQERLMPAQVHDARRIIKNLRAMLRLTRGALNDEARRARNEALRNLADPLSAPRDAAVTLAAFESLYDEGLDGDPHPKAEPSWAIQLHQSLSEKARAIVPAESYQDAVEEVRRLGQLLPLEDVKSRDGRRQTHGNNSWESIVQEGLRKSYRQGRGRMRQVVANPKASDEEWHELGKRVKDLGYQLNLLKKVRGVKPLLRKLDEVGTALGDARDLTLLRDCLGNVQDKNKFTPSDRCNYERLLTNLEEQSQALHRHALKLIGGVYRRGSKRFAARLAKRFRQWQDG
jgi:CHAD domain-containing protein